MNIFVNGVKYLSFYDEDFNSSIVYYDSNIFDCISEKFEKEKDKNNLNKIKNLLNQDWDIIAYDFLDEFEGYRDLRETYMV